jgi:DNA gyrase subunit A
MQPNFDEKEMEPTVLPARFPNLLVNGSTGIAVGMATNIPPHNLREIIDGIVHLIDHRDCTVADLMQFVKGPDFPTAATVRGLNGIRDMYENGRGHIHMRGVASIETDARDKPVIIINELPYAVNKATLIEKMASLVTDKKLEGISDLRDESDKRGIRVVIELKRGAIPDVVLNNIFKQTQLATTFGAILLAIDHGRPRVLNLKELMECFVAHRFEVITRRTRFELAKAEARAHILEGLLIALDNLDEVVRVIRASRSRDEARAELISRFGLSELQANAILEMRLYQLTGLERDKIEKEYKEVMERIAYLRDLLDHEQKIYEVMKEDLLEIREKYGSDRRTQILPDEGEINIEDLLANKPWIVTLSHAGYIKRVDLETYREQRRGGRGVAAMNTRDEDFVEHVFTANTHDFLLFFTEHGRVYWKKAYEIPEAPRTSRGKAIVNFLQLGEEEKIAATLCLREFPEDQHLVMATRNGIVKKTNLSAYSRPRADGIIAIRIDEDDKLMGVKLTGGDDELMLVTRKGKSIRFKEEQLRDLGRATRGVTGIRMAREGDEVKSIEVVEPGGSLLTITEHGYGKRTAFDDYPVQNRGGQGVITIRTSERNGDVVGAHAAHDTDALVLITQGGVMIRMKMADLRVIARNTQGVRLIRLEEGDRLVSATTLSKEVTENEEEVGEESAPPPETSVEPPPETSVEPPAED